MAKPILTAEYVRRLFHYDPKTGALTWKQRPITDFADERARKIWNTRYAGAAAGCLNCDGYLVVGIDRRTWMAHQIAWLHHYGIWPESRLDHRNRRCSDNWIDNLREATQAQNLANQSLRTNNTSGVKGVHKRNKKWQAGIRVSGRFHYLGLHETVDEAAQAYAAAAKRFYGEFATDGN